MNDAANLVRHCESYKGADPRRALVQLATTILLFAAACAAEIYCIRNGYWVFYALLLLPASGFLVRLFIIQHDCGHGSFFPAKFCNDLTGRFLSVLTATPYGFWRRTHNMHHAGSGNLERRGYGGIETLTVAEYRALPRSRKIFYRLYRNPFILLVLGTPLFIMLGQRFPLTEPFAFSDVSANAKMQGAWQSVMGLNIALAVFYGLAFYALGAAAVLLIALPVLVITSWIGGWLFYIQHQFEDTYWGHGEDWNFRDAALHGSSYYDLHPVLHWFTGNIGMHHIHHFCSAIPNYRLRECLESLPELKTINRITLGESLRCATLALWDEERRKLVSFREALAAGQGAA